MTVQELVDHLSELVSNGIVPSTAPVYLVEATDGPRPYIQFG